MYNDQIFLTDLAAIRDTAPLVHNITNFVVMNNTANALLCVGASPVMAHAVQEVEQMVSIASSLVINVGTLSDSWVDAMELAMLEANRRGIPVIYDPVGAGATEYRNQVNRRLLATASPTIIRGNGSEIMSLINTSVSTKGVDSTAASSDALQAAKALSLSTGAVVVISGQKDYIVNGEEVFVNEFGVELMGRITGMGCTATAICGAFAAVNPNPMQAAIGAMRLMGLCGQAAYRKTQSPGSFQVAFLDALYEFK